MCLGEREGNSFLCPVQSVRGIIRDSRVFALIMQIATNRGIKNQMRERKVSLSPPPPSEGRKKQRKLLIPLEEAR